MGSLYDNSGEDIYARRDIEKRRKHAMAMKKKRKRQILKRKMKKNLYMHKRAAIIKR